MLRGECLLGQSIYVHIPFCAHICHYCDFNKVFLENQPVEAYLDALIEEMRVLRERQGDVPVRTVYIGGGTPTALTSFQLARLLEKMHMLFSVQGVEEWTVEVNPDSADREKLAVLHEHGVNRLSIGAQTFTPALLQEIGRSHSPKSVKRAVETARSVGFTNVSLDLMLGLPNQTEADFSDSLEQALALGVEHISAYALKVEPKTIFFNRQKKGTLPLPPEETDVAMYHDLQRKTRAAGLVQYEISNFGKSGYESKHNLVYWNNEEYDGVGAGASGYEQGVRYQNIAPIQQYIDAVWEKGVPRLQTHRVTRVEKLEEAAFLGLRKREGICKADFAQAYGEPFTTLFREPVMTGIQKGLLEETHSHIRLSEDGLLLGNEAFSLFIASLEDVDE